MEPQDGSHGTEERLLRALVSRLSAIPPLVGGRTARAGAGLTQAQEEKGEEVGEIGHFDCSTSPAVQVQSSCRDDHFCRRYLANREEQVVYGCSSVLSLT